MKISVSLDRDDLETLKKHAQKEHDGNLSAAFASAAKLLRQREARDRLIRMLGGPSLTEEAAAAIDQEQAGGPRQEPRKKSKRAA